MNNTNNKNGALNQGIFCSHCQMAIMSWQGGTIHQAEKEMTKARKRAK